MTASNLGNKEVFAKNLASYVKRSGKQQKEIAEIVGVPPSTFNGWMKAKKYPRIDKIEKLADYFGCKKSDLIEKKPTSNGGLSENKQALLDFAKSVPENKAEMILKVIRSILEDN